MTQLRFETQAFAGSDAINVYLGDEYLGMYNTSVYYPDKYIATGFDENGEGRVTYVNSENEALDFILKNTYALA